MNIDPAVFLESSISEETARFNTMTEAMLAELPDKWSFPPQVIRDLRDQGRGPFPLPPLSPRAETIEIPGVDGMIALRLIRPQAPARGVYLHIHGGGWTFGAPHHDDARLETIADKNGLVAVSVKYRLAPENPYPAGPDDCEAAALWLVANAPERFATGKLTIGGESAGAHLSVVTLLRLRDRHGITPFCAANLEAGCYDLALTPSARRFGSTPLILNTRDIRKFVEGFVPAAIDVGDPDISVLHADLAGMPPALFSVGTRDALLDDSLFMAARWQAAGNRAELAVFPGGCHVFQSFPIAIGRQSLERMDAFLQAAVAD